MKKLTLVLIALFAFSASAFAEEAAAPAGTTTEPTHATEPAKTDAPAAKEEHHADHAAKPAAKKKAKKGAAKKAKEEKHETPAQ